MESDRPKSRPPERFWPYAELPEQPTDEELAALDPDLHDALFGVQPRPFSITLVFPRHRVARISRARSTWRARRPNTARPAAAPRSRYRARFWSGDALQLRTLFEIVGGSPDTEVLIDDRPLPYARELWLPLIWFLIFR